MAKATQLPEAGGLRKWLLRVSFHFPHAWEVLGPQEELQAAESMVPKPRDAMWLALPGGHRQRSECVLWEGRGGWHMPVNGLHRAPPQCPQANRHKRRTKGGK